jgi:uncharacterized integral membrane protein
MQRIFGVIRGLIKQVYAHWLSLISISVVKVILHIYLSLIKKVFDIICQVGESHHRQLAQLSTDLLNKHLPHTN